MKLSIGQYNSLEIVKDTPQGLYLQSSEGEILLPGKFIKPEFTIGAVIDVFVYTDSEDRLVATTQQPKIVTGAFAALDVIQITTFGAFLDWGLDKDLLLPYKEQPYALQAGERVVVRAVLDHKTQRVIAVAKVEAFLQKDTSGLSAGEAVEVLVYGKTPMGWKAIINQQYGGMLYQNEIFTTVERGDQFSGFIKKVREDGKLDISLRPTGFDAIQEAKDEVMKKLQETTGFMPFHDNSDPESIKASFNMSKKSFKKAIGGLLKEGKINITAEGIQLK